MQKKRFFSMFLALVLVLGVWSPPLSRAEQVVEPKAMDQGLTSLTAKEPVVSKNINRHDYAGRTFSKPVSSYLYQDQDFLVRVEYLEAGKGGRPAKLVVEAYDAGFDLVSQRELPIELPLWGGFFAGREYNYLVFGQENLREDNKAEVIRVVQYSKDWRRLGQASLYGAETTIPFHGGNLRMAEDDFNLYVRTSRERYRSRDGLNHQMNLTMVVRQSDLEVEDANYQVKQSKYGYVSHSFNQFVLVDGENQVVTADHGDAYPRSLALNIYNPRTDQSKQLDVLKIPGRTGDNYTGVSLGGLEEFDTGYLMAYSEFERVQNYGQYFVWLAHIPEQGAINLYKVARTGQTPHLVARDSESGYLLWAERDLSYQGPETFPSTLYYAPYQSGTNDILKDVKVIEGVPLSDCKPIPYQDGIIWYVTDRSGPVFYHLGPEGLIERAPRLAGPSRIETAIEASKKAYPEGAKVAVLAGVQGEIDALTGSLLAANKQAPLLLIKDYDARIKEELRRLGVEKIILLGGSNSISRQVEREIESDYSVVRISGSDRLETAAAVAKNSVSSASHVFLANDGRSGSLADVLAIGPVAGRDSSPILLAGKDDLPAETLLVMEELGVKEVTLVGGSGSLSSKLARDLEQRNFQVNRVAGANRWETASKISKIYFESPELVLVANDGRKSFADALVAGYLGAKENAPVLLASAEKSNSYLEEAIGTKVERAYVLGGRASLSEGVRQLIEKLVRK